MKWFWRMLVVAGICVLLGVLEMLIIQHLNTEPPVAIFAPPTKHGVVYDVDFTHGHANYEWSSRNISNTPKGTRKILGPFGETPLTFSIDGLAPHQLVHLTFELLTFRPWNGDSANFGRDLWDMRVVGGQPLIHTTFSNCGFFDDNNEQSYPDQYPWYPTHPGFTGVLAKQSLGYMFNWGQGRKYGVDSTYLIDITFPHTGEVLMLRFKSAIKQHQNKPYGFLSFRVETLDHYTVASDAMLTAWWNNLAGEDAVKANQALWQMVSTGDAATKFIESHFPAVDPTIPININQHDHWEYESFEYSTPSQRQRARTIHALEAIGTPAALKVLTDIGYKGTPQGGPPTNWG